MKNSTQSMVKKKLSTCILHIYIFFYHGMYAFFVVDLDLVSSTCGLQYGLITIIWIFIYFFAVLANPPNKTKNMQNKKICLYLFQVL